MSTDVVERFRSAQYLGSNGSAVVAAIGGSMISDDGITLKFFAPDSSYCQLAVTDWAVWLENPAVILVGAPVADATYVTQYTDLQAAVLSYAPTGTSGPAQSLIQSTGGPVAVPASLLGQTANYDVTMNPALPDTSYKPVASLRGAPGIVSGHAILTVTVLNVNTVRVQVQSAAASLAGGNVYVNAFALA